MDEIVRAAMAKWPTVPHCHGWLGLDARGDWYLRDDAVQAAGPFPQAKGSRIEHAGLRAFIARNYEGASGVPSQTTPSSPRYLCHSVWHLVASATERVRLSCCVRTGRVERTTQNVIHLVVS